MPSTSLGRPATRPVAAPREPVFTTVADGVRGQLITRQLLPPHLSSSAHEGQAASCRCRPLLEQLHTARSWAVVPVGPRASCAAEAATLAEEHDLQPLRHALWRSAPADLLLQAYHRSVELLLTMCRYCGAVEVRDVSFHSPAGLRLGILAPRRRSDVLGWYAGKRPKGRIYT
jgi:hypothetical protein